MAYTSPLHLVSAGEVKTLQRLLKPSNSRVKAALVSRLDFRYRQIWPHSEAVGCPYARHVLIIRNKTSPFQTLNS
jgi:hypothetical protein